MEADSGNSRVPFAEENTPPTLVNKVWCMYNTLHINSLRRLVK